MIWQIEAFPWFLTGQWCLMEVKRITKRETFRYYKEQGTVKLFANEKSAREYGRRL